MSTVETAKTTQKKGLAGNVRMMTVTAMLSAIAFILMFVDFSVPFMPSFIKMDISELPALVATFCFGPLSGVIVCLIKNLLHLTITTTGGVGELSNFILGASFVLPAGFIYKYKKNKKTAIIGALVGALVMAFVSFPSNYFVVYPVYYNFMPKEVIIAAYQAILDAAKTGITLNGIGQCLWMFNVPFTFVKGLLSVLITLLIYKPLSPILKGRY